MARVVITLHTKEREALEKLALSELRIPRDQARFILREALIKCGFLESFEYLKAQNTPTKKEGVKND